MLYKKNVYCAKYDLKLVSMKEIGSSTATSSLKVFLLFQLKKLRLVGLVAPRDMTRDLLLQVIQHHQCLRNVFVYQSMHVDDDVLEALGRYTKSLRNLTMVGCNISDAGN